jgi:RimJ/RimL family protein N-acetyltransferase
MAEAAACARDHAFGVLGWKTAVSYIAPANTRSIRLAERLGAVRDPQAPRFPGEAEVLVYRHPTPEVSA